MYDVKKQQRLNRNALKLALSTPAGGAMVAMDSKPRAERKFYRDVGNGPRDAIWRLTEQRGHRSRGG